MVWLDMSMPATELMVTLTRLNGSSLTVNAEMIETIEATPDTIITLTNGRKYLAKEPVDEVVKRVIEYRRTTLKNLIYYREEGES
jgi:flagellar protein FlbD